MACRCVALDCYPYTAGSTMLHDDPVRLQGRVRVAFSIPHPEMAGRQLDDIARSRGCGEVEAVRRLQPGGAIYFMMREDDVRNILAFEHSMVGSDGIPRGERPHPRLWAPFRACSGTTAASSTSFRWRRRCGR
jgi:N-acyl-D-amino-acid deacylase